MVTYKDSGVDIGAADELVGRIARRAGALPAANVLAGIGGFASLVKLPPGLAEPLIVAGTDGVGTKLRVAFATGRHDTVGIDLVAMCVNDVVTIGAAPLFFLDYLACGRLDVEVADSVVAGIVEGCRQAGCPLVGGETAEMPDMYPAGEYDLAGFAVGVVDRARLIDGRDAREGDVALGLPSTGLHSNGYSLVRRLFMPAGGGPDLAARVEELGCTLGEELLRPTKIYAGEVALLAATGEARSIAHITGGGIAGNAARNLPAHLGLALRWGSWRVPPVFGMIERRGVSVEEMLATFNMGLGLVAVVRREAAGACVRALADAGVEAVEAGVVVRCGEGRERVRVER